MNTRTASAEAHGLESVANGRTITLSTYAKFALYTSPLWAVISFAIYCLLSAV
jgi:hypothetical protein